MVNISLTNTFYLIFSVTGIDAELPRPRGRRRSPGFHLEVGCGLVQRTHPVSRVPPGRLADEAEHLSVILAEELHRLPVLAALHLGLDGSGAPRPGFRAGALLLHETLRHVLERQADGRLRQRALAPANGTLAPPRVALPEGLQAGAAEAVATLEHHGLTEDLAAHRARQLLLQAGHGPARRGPPTLQVAQPWALRGRRPPRLGRCTRT